MWYLVLVVMHYQGVTMTTLPSAFSQSRCEQLARVYEAETAKRMRSERFERPIATYAICVGEGVMK